MIEGPKLRTLDELDDEAFQLLVSEEAAGKGAPNDAMLLRTPVYAERWYATLGQLLTDVNNQLAHGKAKYEEQQAGRFGQDMRKLHTRRYQEWRKRALAFRKALESRRAQCKQEAARQKRLRHKQLVEDERSEYFHQLQEVLKFLEDDEIFVYSAWPRRDDLRDRIHHTIAKKH